MGMHGGTLAPELRLVVVSVTGAQVSLLQHCCWCARHRPLWTGHRGRVQGPGIMEQQWLRGWETGDTAVAVAEASSAQVPVEQPWSWSLESRHMRSHHSSGVQCIDTPAVTVAPVSRHGHSENSCRARLYMHIYY